MKRIRLDLFICMIIATALFAGIWFVGDKIGLLEMVFDKIGNIVDRTQDVPDGEVGGYATEDTPRVSTIQEMVNMAQENKTFTVETSAVKYSNYGLLTGKEYEWRILKLDDGGAIALKLNTEKIQDSNSRGINILPVGKVVLEEPEILDDMADRLSGTDVVYITDAYVDMDGEAKATYISAGMKSAMVTIGISSMITPIVLFVLYIVTTLWIHSLFVKKGIFSPVFPNKKI